MSRIEFLMKSFIAFHKKHQCHPNELLMHPEFFNGCVREFGEYVKARHETDYNGVHHFEILGVPVIKDAYVHSAVWQTSGAAQMRSVREGSDVDSDT